MTNKKQRRREAQQQPAPRASKASSKAAPDPIDQPPKHASRPEPVADTEQELDQ